MSPTSYQTAPPRGVTVTLPGSLRGRQPGWPPATARAASGGRHGAADLGVRHAVVEEPAVLEQDEALGEADVVDLARLLGGGVGTQERVGGSGEARGRVERVEQHLAGLVGEAGQG